MATEGGDNLTTLGSTAYSFYLNVVVLNHVPPSPASPSTRPTSEVGNEEGKNESPAQDDDGGDKKKSTSILDKSLHNTMKAMSKTSIAMSKTSIAVSNKAAAYVASKTMVTRASAALAKSLPALAKSTGLDLTIGNRFQQGSVTVLQVDLKATDLHLYIAEVRGEEAAEQFRSAMSALKSLGATDTIGSFEQEMLPQVRRGLMELLSERLIKMMKEKEGGLEVQCIALEENEQARWLFTFLEFQQQMK